LGELETSSGRVGRAGLLYISRSSIQSTHTFQNSSKVHHITASMGRRKAGTLVLSLAKLAQFATLSPTSQATFLADQLKAAKKSTINSPSKSKKRVSIVDLGSTSPKQTVKKMRGTGKTFKEDEEEYLLELYVKHIHSGGGNVMGSALEKMASLTNKVNMKFHFRYPSK
jgi:hypothetical protein